jgi:hypothetical protein
MVYNPEATVPRKPHNVLRRCEVCGKGKEKEKEALCYSCQSTVHLINHAWRVRRKENDTA